MRALIESGIRPVTFPPSITLWSDTARKKKKAPQKRRGMVHPSCRGFTIASKVLAGLATMEQHACALRLVRHVKGPRLRALWFDTTRDGAVKSRGLVLPGLAGA